MIITKNKGPQQRTRKSPKQFAILISTPSESMKRYAPTLLDLASEPEKFEGSTATVVGMVYRDKRLSAASFFCHRLLMICCAADASPIGLIIKWPETHKLTKGMWVKVHGKVGFTMFEGKKYPAIFATKVEKSTPPKKKFVVPK